MNAPKLSSFSFLSRVKVEPDRIFRFRNIFFSQKIIEDAIPKESCRNVAELKILSKISRLFISREKFAFHKKSRNVMLLIFRKMPFSNKSSFSLLELFARFLSFVRENIESSDLSQVYCAYLELFFSSFELIVQSFGSQ